MSARHVLCPTRPSPTLTRTVLEAPPGRKQGPGRGWHPFHGLLHTRAASRSRARSRAWKRRWPPGVCHVSMRPAADQRDAEEVGRCRHRVPLPSTGFWLWKTETTSDSPQLIAQPGLDPLP